MRGPGLLRFSLWWQHIVPPVLAAAYLATASEALTPGELVALLPLFVVSIVGIAGFGYFLNDACDIAADRAGGKANAAADHGQVARAAILLGLLLLGLAPWSLLPRHPVNLALLGLQVGALTLYSVRPLRLKERGFAGVLADTLYGHLLPVAIALFTFFPEPLPNLAATQGSRTAGAILLPTGIVLTCKGLRNILLHQLADRANDRRAGLRTFVLTRGPVRALALINRLLLPLELGALAATLVLLAPAAPVWVGFAAFLAFTALMFSAWKFPFLPQRQLRFKFLYFLNDFYEEWLPPTVLAIAVARHGELWPLLPLHFLLFPKGLAKIPRNLSVLRENFVHAADF
ncbi:MAG: UbiA family prenyltransferase [Thermoanaerobaculia bacterium]